MRVFGQDRGAVLVAVLILAIIVAVFCVTSLLLSSTESKGTAANIQRDEAFFVAEAGLEDEFKALSDTMTKSSGSNPFQMFDALAGKTVISARALTSGGINVGEYDVVINSVTAVDSFNRDIALTATGYVPSKSHSSPVTREVAAVVRVGQASSSAFRFVTFINNYLWFGDSMNTFRGNVGTNGVADLTSKKFIITPYPRFSQLSNGTFSGKLDDGGIYAGWNIWDGKHVSLSSPAKSDTGAYQMPFQPKVAMPNLKDLTLYEEAAKAAHSSIKVGSSTVCNAVLGDVPGEKSNLYLDGQDEDHPIVLNGPVVVRGNLFIKGQVTGKGSIYVGGNIYIGGAITYVHPLVPPPDSVDPAIQQKMQANLAANQGADALGLFTANNIIVGDYTDSKWRADVAAALSDPHIGNGEDNGGDAIPNTQAGRDGTSGTADDDVLEDDGKWTVSYYTSEDAALGRIPTGKLVGDVIAGTGEDGNGNGKYDRPTTVNDFPLTTPINSWLWAGNLPKIQNAPYGIYCDQINSIDRLDGVFLAGNSFATFTKKPTINGALYAGMVATDFRANHLVMNYDLRLLLPDDSSGRLLPKAWQPLMLLMWRSN